jgi:S1-C subfamily serine protease
MRRLVPGLVAILLVSATTGLSQDLKRLQKEFMSVGERVVPATVIVRGAGAMKGLMGSSGVIISPDGLILSDADATLMKVTPKRDAAGQPTRELLKEHAEDALIALPDPDRRRFRARLLHRDEDADIALLQIVDPPRKLPFCPIGRSDELAVGSFTYVCGNSFGAGNEGKPSISAGIVAALVPSEVRAESRFARIYTTSAVNRGNNGGPMVDLEGSLVGIVSTFDQVPGSAFRGFGVVTPIDRVMNRLRGAALDESALPEPPRVRAPRESRVLEQALRILADRAEAVVVSLTIEREGELPKETVMVPPRMRGQPPQKLELPRYPGPYSGLCLTRDGYILTTTANLLEREKIKSITARLADGRELPATLVARDVYRMIALLKVEATDLPVLEAAEEGDIEPGRFVLALGNPFGSTPHRGPMVTFGIVSALHKISRRMDAVQTDAGMNDANIGGPLIDLQGRLVGLNLLVSPQSFGRNSGVGFAVPIWSIEKSLDELKAGRDLVPPYLGIQQPVAIEGGLFRFLKVLRDGPAYKQGLRDGDVLLKFAGRNASSFETPEEVLEEIRKRKPGDVLALEVRRGRERLTLKIKLEAHPRAK